MKFIQKQFFVLGGGVSGKSAIQLLKNLGSDAILVDQNDGILDSSENASKYLTPDTITSLIKSPGISPTHPWILHAKSLGIPVVSEIDLGFEVFHSINKNPNKISIGITGTDGKSTTTALTHHILKKSFPSKVVEMGGNIGRPFTEFCNQEWDIAVLELSSYQLEDSKPDLCKISAFLNIAPDHLDRHGTMENYIQAKSRIAFRNDNDSLLIINIKTLPLALPYLDDFIGKFLVFGDSNESIPNDPRIDYMARIYTNNYSITTNKKTYNATKFPLPGYHNLENLAAAILLCESVGCDPVSIEQGFVDFSGLSHRFEYFFQVDNWRFVNDSKSTNLHSLISWLGPYPKDSARIYLLIGGRPKDEPIQPLIEILVEKNVEIYLYGEASVRWREQFLIFSNHCHFLENMEEALVLIKSQYINNHQSPTLVVLSPACSSFDQFKNFEERGHYFKSLVSTLFEI